MSDRHEVIPLARLRLDGGTQLRCETDRGYIDELVLLFDEQTPTWPPALPPGLAYFDGTAYWVADGHHRYGAALEAGCVHVPVLVREGSRRDAVLYACGANEAHGLRRSTADRARVVRVLLEDPEWSTLPTNRICQICRLKWHVVQPIVEEIRGKAKVVTVTRADGKQYQMDTSRIGTKPCKTGTADTAAPRPRDEPSRAREGDTPPPTDSLGIPCRSAEAEAAFAVLPQFAEVEKLLQAAAARINQLAQAPGGECYREQLRPERSRSDEAGRFHSTHLHNALVELRHWRPHVSICPHCHRKRRPNSPDCTVCRGLPYVIKAEFERAPEDLRKAVLTLAEG